MPIRHSFLRSHWCSPLRRKGVHRYGEHVFTVTAERCSPLRRTPTTPKKRMTTPKKILAFSSPIMSFSEIIPIFASDYDNFVIPSSELDVFFLDDRQSSLRRAECGSVTKWQSDTKRAMGGTCSPDILKAFTWRSVLDESNLANSFYQSLEHSNGRCPRVWFI